MNILRNAGTHTILRITENPLQLIEQCGRVAYQSQDKITSDSAIKFVKMLLDRGHESVLEHASMTVRFDNVSRGFSHELVRHRLCSFTQESTRYVDESDFNVVVPPHQDTEKSFIDVDHASTMTGDRIPITLEEWLWYCESVYRQLRKAGWPAQDARQILPIAIKSQIVCTANFRQWRHILKLRTQKQAHWEIRRVMTQLLSDVCSKVPVVFSDIKPEFTYEEAESWDWHKINIPAPLCHWVSEVAQKSK